MLGFYEMACDIATSIDVQWRFNRKNRDGTGHDDMRENDMNRKR